MKKIKFFLFVIVLIMTLILAACDEKIDNTPQESNMPIGNENDLASIDNNTSSNENNENNENDARAETPAPQPNEPPLAEMPPVISLNYEGGFSASLEMREVVDSLEAGDIEKGMAIINEAFEQTFVIEETKPSTDSSDFGDIFSRGMDDLIGFGSQLITGLLDATGGSTMFDVTKVLEAVADGNMDAGTALLMDVGMSYVIGAVTDALIGSYLTAYVGSPTLANLASIYSAINDAQAKLTVIADMKQ
jgi:hypothetical protein